MKKNHYENDVHFIDKNNEWTTLGPKQWTTLKECSRLQTISTYVRNAHVIFHLSLTSYWQTYLPAVEHPLLIQVPDAAAIEGILLCLFVSVSRLDEVDCDRISAYPQGSS